MSECTWKEAVGVWNEGFQDYFADVKMDADAFTARLVREGLSPELSVMAFHDGRQGFCSAASASSGASGSPGTGGPPSFPAPAAWGWDRRWWRRPSGFTGKIGRTSPAWRRSGRISGRSLCTNGWDIKRSTGSAFTGAPVPCPTVSFAEGTGKVTPSGGGVRRRRPGSPFTG